VHQFFIRLALALFANLAWLAIWGAVLRAFGIFVLQKSPEQRTAARERILRLGKLRYILIFGILGYGFAFALALDVAEMAREFTGWVSAIIMLIVFALPLGSWMGVRMWNESYRGEVPFPPHFPPQSGEVPFPPQFPPQTGEVPFPPHFPPQK
jgi:hypothetical protein